MCTNAFIAIVRVWIKGGMVYSEPTKLFVCLAV